MRSTLLTVSRSQKITPTLSSGGRAVGELVLNDQVLGPLGIDKGRSIAALLGHDGFHALDAVSREALFHHLGRTGNNLVDHAPGEADLGLIIDPIHKALLHQAVFAPGLGNLRHTVVEGLAVMAAVIEAAHGQRIAAGLIPPVQELGQGSHGVFRVVGAFLHIGLHGGEQRAVGIVELVALLRNGEGEHLQAGIREDFLEAGHGRLVGAVGLDALGNAADDLPAGGSVRVERHRNAQVVKGRVGDVQNGRIVGVGHEQALIQSGPQVTSAGQSGKVGPGRCCRCQNGPR